MISAAAPNLSAFGLALAARPATRVDRTPAKVRIGEAGMAVETELGTLMAAAQAGDAIAYRALLKACLPLVTAMVRAKGVRGAAVDDVVQDALMTVHRARASYDPARPFLPWLRAITQRRAVDRLRRAGRQPLEVHDPLAYEAEADPGPAPGLGLEAHERKLALARAVAALPEGQRQAVEHLSMRELTLEETAALTGRSKGALKVNLHRALRTLRASLTQEKG